MKLRCSPFLTTVAGAVALALCSGALAAEKKPKATGTIKDLENREITIDRAAPTSSRLVASSPDSSRKSSPQRARMSRPRSMLPVASLMPMICGWAASRSTVSGSRSQAVRDGTL